jgi:DMSO/TMAO reductase YedYZ molybdopterin-dependent catalytic subunit
MSHDGHDPDWLHGHPHEPNPAPPSPNAEFTLRLSGAEDMVIAADALTQLPRTEVADCLIVSTGHGTSGPFRFGGVTLRDLLRAYLPADFSWQHVDVVSGDGFGNRVEAAEVNDPSTTHPILLADTIDGRPLTREEGLVRLIVPNEIDDALRQVKWVAEIRLS